MSSSSVWVQIYYKGKYEPKGQPVEIEPIPKNVGALKAIVLPKLDPTELAEIFVYPPDTEPPFSDQTAIRGDKIVEELIDEFGNKNPPLSIGYDHPLIVVAPAPPQPAPFLVNCRTWSNENNHPGIYRLRANSYNDLNQQASHKFELAAAKLSLYFIPDGKNIDSRKKIKEDSDLEDFMQLGGNPVVLAWEQGSDGSPKELPGEIALPFSGSAASSLSTSTRGYIQKLFQAQLLERDKSKCVVSGKQFKQGSGNVEAAHIIPVASPLNVRHRAGLRGLYDTRNGMLLESRLHKAFDSYVWCMNEEGKFCLSDAKCHIAEIGKYELSQWEGKTLNLRIGIDPDAPTKATLKARYDLFLAKVKEKKQKENKKSKASLTKKN
ncbi:HNH endonuclease [Nitzschia inconspicua]|uniref:HNH endonuclease n=1 Tax=Nitzschia inconspicua TaxID=303405 RepID=A0A9K3M2S0_9STRA|nr:HNH endonuclease [Nitzschia inconspicua]